MTIFLALAVAFASSKKMIVTYLGTDFILPGGCPSPSCDPSLRDCRAEQIEREKIFNECMETKAAKQGCFTDPLPDKSFITIPVLANFCSKHCGDNSLNAIHECPHEGFIHTQIDAELSRKINNPVLKPRFAPNSFF